MSTIRKILLGVALGGIALYSWALFSMNILLSNLSRFLWLGGSVVVLGVLIALVVGAGRRLVVDQKSESTTTRLALVIGLIVSVLVTAFVAVVVLDWPISFFREAGRNESLPQGNLLVAGGRPGWTYFVLFALLVYSIIPLIRSGWKKWPGSRSDAKTSPRMMHESSSAHDSTSV